jgi:glutamine amidotransferase
MLTIVDYGMGNVGSILNMLKKIGVPARLSCRPEDILSAEKIILPGVGAFDAGMKRLRELDLVSVLEEKVVKQGAPLLGICLGMQLLTESSEEGAEPGLGWIQARTKRFRFDENLRDLKVPHMGWNLVSIRSGRGLFHLATEETRFYFVHSYHVVCDQPQNTLAETTYGYPFVSSFSKDNIFGVQFHPEKSHKFGMQLLKNFTERVC